MLVENEAGWFSWLVRSFEAQPLDIMGQMVEGLPDQGALFGAETVEGFRHEIVADAEAGEGALDAFDDRGRMTANRIQTAADAHDLRLQFLGALQVSRASSLGEADV